MSEARDNRAATREELHRAVDLFIDRQRIKLRRDGSHAVDWQTLPSLWEQLETATMWTGKGEGGGGFGTRPVISTEVVALLIEVSQATSEAAVEFGECSRRHVPQNLRLVAANLPADDDLLAWWLDTVKRWAREARAALRLDPERPQWARDTKCPECGADSARAMRDGEEVRTPALAINWVGPQDDEHHPDSAWKVRAVECRSCGASWFRGSGLDDLVTDLMRKNLEQETLAEDGAA